MGKTDNQLSTNNLYPDLSSEQQAEAASYLAQYIDVICRIYERNKDDLTALDQKATI